MAFTKRNYVAHETIITAENLNDIQDELLRAGGTIDPGSDEDYEIGVDENGIYFLEKENNNG